MTQPSNHQQSGVSNTFSTPSQQQSNPFTADFKGEFTSNFGTNTNAVSQIFKEGNFVGQSRAKVFILVGVLVGLIIIAGFVLMSGDDTEADFAEEASTIEDGDEGFEDVGATTAGAGGEMATAPMDEPMGMEAAAPAAAPAAAAARAQAPMARQTETFAGGAIGLVSPANGQMVNYDETQQPPAFSWSGGGDRIAFSRNPDMSPVFISERVSGGSYMATHLYPGTWYWKVSGGAGESEVRSFNVSSPARRNVMVTSPAAGGQVAGSGGAVTWQGDDFVAFYRVELTTGGWASPAHKFSTRGTSVQLQGVAPGAYQMRVGAFSEVGGRWEYTSPVNVTVR